MLRHVHMAVYDGFEILDMAGPAAVFGSANVVADFPAYSVSVRSVHGGSVRCSMGITLQTERFAHAGPQDTVLVVGAEVEPLRQALRNAELLGWLEDFAASGARVGSVCTGAFLLGRSGLLDGVRATTHWAARPDLARLFPRANVESDALYVADGNIWSSAGIATGIDMALAMVARDLGSSVMHEVARRMVVYAHRPGKQSQFSRLLDDQRRTPQDLSDLIAHIDANLSGDLSLSRLAEVAAMSERTLHRRFVRDIGQSPARYVESVRMERARLLLEQGLPIKQVAPQVGYRTEQGFRAVFEARFSVPPSLHRRLHGTSRIEC